MGKIMKKWTPLFLCISLFFASCVSELEKYYETPDWLKGNTWEVLEKKGNFKLFLKAIERSSYKDLVQGKGINTVMAPTDSAFQAYLTANQIIFDSLKGSQLDRLIGYHLLYYSFNKEALENYRPNGSESQNLYPGMYYKFRTKSCDPISVETDFTNDKVHKVIHNDRFLPVFSQNIFNSFQVDAKSNYEFFYPGSTWTGSNGFNVSSASVKEYGLVSDNGYVYVIDKVLEPQETIFKTLAADAAYSKFLSSFERFAAYAYDPTSTTDFGKGDSLYIKYYSNVLPSIASEWPVSSYQSLSILSYGAHNVFAPDNTAMQAFFEKYWAPYYTDISKVNFEPLLAFLQNHVYSSTILFPEMIERGTIKSNYGTPITFNRSAAQKKSICVNGAIYGLNESLVPSMFTKVTSPMYCDPKYNMFLDMCINSSYISTLISNGTSFKVFYPSDNMILNNSNLDGKLMYWVNTNPKQYGAQTINIDGDLGQQAMSINQKKTLSGAHIATSLISSRGTNEAVYRTLLPYTYIYTKDNKVYSSYLFNLGVDSKVPTFSKIATTSDNGDAYELTGETASALVPESSRFLSYTATTGPADLKLFLGYTTLAGFMSSTPAYDFIQGNRYIILVPPSTVLASYYASLTGTATEKQTKMAAYMKSYFINVDASGLLDYPFPGANVQGELTTFGKKASDGTTAKFTLVDRGNELVIVDGKGNEAKITNYFPRIYADGAVYTIDKGLSVE